MNTVAGFFIVGSTDRGSSQQLQMWSFKHFSRQNLLRSLSRLLFLLRWNRYGAKKCLQNHIPFDFWDDSTLANQGAGKTIEKPLNKLPWNQQFSYFPLSCVSLTRPITLNKVKQQNQSPLFSQVLKYHKRKAANQPPSTCWKMHLLQQTPLILSWPYQQVSERIKCIVLITKTTIKYDGHRKLINCARDYGDRVFNKCTWGVWSFEMRTMQKIPICDDWFWQR